MKETDTYHLFGNIIRFHARGEAGYCLVEVTTAPGAGVPPNSHPADNEVFCILEGSYVFNVEGKERSARTGDVVVIPNGAVHSLKNTGDAPGRMFIFNAPGQVHASFFSEIGEPMPSGSSEFPPPPEKPPNVEGLVKRARELGITFHS